MKAKTMSKLDANLNLTIAINAAILAAHQAGLSEEDIKAVLNRMVEIIDNEE